MRTAYLEGRLHVVVPVVMIVEGVLNGSGGALLYLADDIRNSVPFWNGKSVLIAHPDGSSANTPEVFNRQKVGVIMAAAFDGKRLTAEAWLDVLRLEEVDSQLHSDVMAGKTLEVSTGLYTDSHPQAGVFNGVAYKAIARNFKPDHLAILVDEEGACSVNDGCGLARNQRMQVIDDGAPLELPVMDWGAAFIR